MYDEIYGPFGYKEKEPDQCLSHIGTRYLHLQELREIWELGLSVLEGMNQAYLSPADEAKMGALRNAIFLITKHLDNLSGMSNHSQGYWALKHVVDSIEPRRY